MKKISRFLKANITDIIDDEIKIYFDITDKLQLLKKFIEPNSNKNQIKIEIIKLFSKEQYEQINSYPSEGSLKEINKIIEGLDQAFDRACGEIDRLNKIYPKYIEGTTEDNLNRNFRSYFSRPRAFRQHRPKHHYSWVN